jgi:hypothetical protein
MSNGIHGGYFGIKQHIFPFTDMKKKLYIPLPVIGSIYPSVAVYLAARRILAIPLIPIW